MAQAVGDGGSGSSSGGSNLSTGLQGAELAMKFLKKEDSNPMVRRMSRPIKTPEEALNEALKASGG